MRTIILLIVVLICSGVAVRRPYIGVLTFAWLGFFNPQSYTWVEIPYSLIVALATVSGFLLSSEPKTDSDAARNDTDGDAMGNFWRDQLVCYVFPDRAMIQLNFVSKIFLMVFITICVLTSQDKLHSLVRVIALSLGFYAVKSAIFVVMTGGTQMVWDRRILS